MNRTAHPIFFILISVLGLVFLAGCSSPTEITTPMVVVISPVLTETATPAPDADAVGEDTFQATLNSNKTQNAAYLATSAAIKTARPPTATPTRRPTATPTEEGLGRLVDGILVHDADTRTGLKGVDQIIDIVLEGDMNQFRQSIKYTTSGCTHVMALGGPPKCREGEAEGTLIEALPFLGPEGHFLRRDDINGWQGIDAAGLYAVYRVSDQAFSSKDYPAGDYGIVFRTKFPRDIVTLQVEYSSILRFDSTFIQDINPDSSIPPELIFEREAEEIILPPPNIKECPGAPPQRVTIGEQASVCTQSEDLFVREEPGPDGKEIIGIEPGLDFRIVDGPSCASNWSWWKVELDSGLTGWVAEGGDSIDPYFICPLN